MSKNSQATILSLPTNCQTVFCSYLQDVEKFAQHRQQLGTDITKVCFEDAEHVKIYTKYPQQYIHCICKFINSCLSYRGSTKYD